METLSPSILSMKGSLQEAMGKQVAIFEVLLSNLKLLRRTRRTGGKRR